MVSRAGASVASAVLGALSLGGWATPQGAASASESSGDDTDSDWAIVDAQSENENENENESKRTLSASDGASEAAAAGHERESRRPAGRRRPHQFSALRDALAQAQRAIHRASAHVAVKASPAREQRAADVRPGIERLKGAVAEWAAAKMQRSGQRLAPSEASI